MELAPRTRPAAEVDIDVSLVHRLLEAQFPQWSELPVRPIESSGWDNAIYRLGTDLAVRLPRRKIAAHFEREHDWLPVLGPQLPLVTPVPLGKGVAGEGYPWHWTVCPWLTGEVAAASPAEDMRQAAARLTGFIAALQAIDPSGGPVNQFRSGPLVTRDPVVRGAAALGRAAGAHLALAAWEAALAAPAWTGGPVWMHGDLHPANLLVEDGELTAVIDSGRPGRPLLRRSGHHRGRQRPQRGGSGVHRGVRSGPRRVGQHADRRPAAPRTGTHRAKFQASFAGDVPAEQAAFMADSQVPLGVDALSGSITEPAWRTKPSWYLVTTEDRMISPPAQRAMSERAGSTVVESAGSHSIYLSQPTAVASLIEQAASAVAEP